jgi:hypothetical protein
MYFYLYHIDNIFANIIPGLKDLNRLESKKTVLRIRITFFADLDQASPSDSKPDS